MIDMYESTVKVKWFEELQFRCQNLMDVAAWSSGLVEEIDLDGYRDKVERKVRQVINPTNVLISSSAIKQRVMSSVDLPSSSSDLFGKDDSEFLEALGNVKIDLSPKGLYSVSNEPSSSLDLFGTEDSAFLDALARTALPGDTEQLPVAGNLHLVKSQGQTQGGGICGSAGSGNQSRKRSRSLEQELEPNLSYSHVVRVPNVCSDDGTTYSEHNDIYGPSKFNGFGEYMHRKRAKLNIQNAEIEDLGGGKKSILFHGLSLYVCLAVKFSQHCKAEDSNKSRYSLDQWQNKSFCASTPQTYCPAWRNFSSLS